MPALSRVGIALLPLLAACGGNTAKGGNPIGPPQLCVLSTPPTVARSAAPSAPSGLAESAWPAFQHDARHSSTSTAIGPTTGRINWQRRLEGNVTPGAVVAADGTIYAASNGGVLHAIDPQSGADRWSFDGGGSYGVDLSTAPAVLRDGTILWPGPRNTLFALDPAGQLVWRQPFSSMPLSPAVTAAGTIYVVEMNGHLHAFDRLPDGLHERWSSDLGTRDTSYGSPAIAADGSVYATVGNRIVAVRDAGQRPELRWSFGVRSGSEVSPAAGLDGSAVFGTNDAYEYGLDATGRERWRYPRASLSYSSPAITDGGLAYFGDHNGYMNVVDARSGCLVVRYQGGNGDEVWTAPAIDAAANVYFGTKAGHILGFAFAGRQLFDIDTGATVDSYPAITGDGTLLIGSANGMLYAIHD